MNQRTVGYPSTSWASCLIIAARKINLMLTSSSNQSARARAGRARQTIELLQRETSKFTPRGTSGISTTLILIQLTVKYGA